MSNTKLTKLRGELSKGKTDKGISADEYKKRFAKRRKSILEGIARGEQDIHENRVFSHAEAKQRMSRWLK